MTLRSFRRYVVPLVALAALAVPAAASADPAPTRVMISQNAQYVSPSHINLGVALTCTPGFGYFVSVQVVQPQGFFQVFGSGFENGQCSGQHQKIAVSVFTMFFPGWELGDAVASVVACAGPCDQDTRTIRISL